MPEYGTGLGMLKELVESGTRIRLAPGVIGKSAMIHLGVVALWAIILVKLSPTEVLFNAQLIGVGILLTLGAMRETQKMRDYAEKNPGPALLEGAEFLAFKRFEATAKELPAGDKSPPESGPMAEGTDVTKPKGPQP
jgi:hypothetical protein